MQVSYLLPGKDMRFELCSKDKSIVLYLAVQMWINDRMQTNTEGNSCSSATTESNPSLSLLWHFINTPSEGHRTCQCYFLPTVSAIIAQNCMIHCVPAAIIWWLLQVWPGSWPDIQNWQVIQGFFSFFHCLSLAESSSAVKNPISYSSPLCQWIHHFKLIRFFLQIIAVDI